MALISFDSNVCSDCKNSISSAPTSISVKNIRRSNLDMEIISEDLSEDYIEDIHYPISGTIFLDNNDNDSKNDTENMFKYEDNIFLEDINAKLYNANNPKTPLVNTPLNENGYFEFKNIDLDYYFIKVILPNSNYMLIENENYSQVSSNTLLSKIIYNNEESSTNMLISLKKCFTISGIIFFDKDNNFAYNNFSTGINNIHLTLYDESNNVLCSTTTSKFAFLHGYYEFKNLLPGKYKIIAHVPSKLKITNKPSNNSSVFEVNSKSRSIVVNITNEDISNIFIGINK